MYVKLAFRNMKRSAKDYLIYLLTLIISIGLFYGFLSITSPFYNNNLPVHMNYMSLEYFCKRMKIIIPSIALLLIFLISYVNKYMLKRRQKEFALQTIMGMEQRTTAYLFFLETLILGIIATIIGIILGILLSQIISAIIMSSFGEKYQFYFSIFPDTILWTLLFFFALFLIIGIENIHLIKKQKIIDMLQESHKTENNFTVKNAMIKWIITGLFMAIFTLYMNFKGIFPLWNNLSQKAIKITVISTISTSIFLILAVAFIVVYFILKKDRISILIFMSITSIISGIYMLKLWNGFDELIRLGVLKQFYYAYPPFIAVGMFVFSISTIFNCFSSLLIFMKSKSKSFKYHNLFLLGQITSKIKTNSKVMAILTCILLASLVMLSWLPIKKAQIDGYLKERSRYDVQIFSQYRIVKNIDDLPKSSINYSYIDNYLKDGGYNITNSANVETYFLKDSDFDIKITKDLPVLGISLSDYNALLKLSGYDEISLPNDGFSVTWRNDALPHEMKQLEKKAPCIQAGKYSLTKVPGTDYQLPVGMGLYTSRMKAAYILPDFVCDNLTLATTYYVANTVKPLSYDFAKKMDTKISNWLNNSGIIPKDSGYIRLRTLQLNQGISNSLMLRLGGSYTCLVLIISCFTILALQQLTDSVEHKKRFSIIKKLGVDSKYISKYIKQQMSVWFGIPVLVAFFGAGGVLTYLAFHNYANYIPYITVTKVVVNILSVFSIFLLVLFCYFVVTYILFKRNITE